MLAGLLEMTTTRAGALDLALPRRLLNLATFACFFDMALECIDNLLVLTKLGLFRVVCQYRSQEAMSEAQGRRGRARDDGARRMRVGLAEYTSWQAQLQTARAGIL